MACSCSVNSLHYRDRGQGIGNTTKFMIMILYCLMFPEQINPFYLQIFSIDYARRLEYHLIAVPGQSVENV